MHDTACFLGTLIHSRILLFFRIVFVLSSLCIVFVVLSFDFPFLLPVIGSQHAIRLFHLGPLIHSRILLFFCIVFVLSSLCIVFVIISSIITLMASVILA